MSNIIIIILIILLLFKAMFCAADVSFTYVNKNEINQLAKKKNIKAIRIKKMLDNPNKFFGTLKIGITLLEFLMSAFVLEVFLDKLEVFISGVSDKFILSGTLITTISIIIITFVFSYFTIVIGDLFPKKIARAYPRKITFLTIDALNIVSKIIYPFEFVFNATLKVLMKLFGIKDKKVEKMTEKELKMIIAEGRAEGLFNEDAKRMLLNTLKFEDYKIKDILVPKDKVDFLDANADLKQIISNFKKYNYTRVPVYKDNINNIVGVLNIKDFIFCIDEETRKDFDINKMLRPAFFVNKEDKMEDVFKTMQLNSYSIAVVLGNDLAVEGIITMEDIIEKIVGNIFDEFDKNERKE